MCQYDTQERAKPAQKRKKVGANVKMTVIPTVKHKCVLIIRLQLFAITIVFDGAAAAFRAAFLFFEVQIVFHEKA